MELQLPDSAREAALDALELYARESLDQPLGRLGVGALLDHVLAVIGPAIYNQAVTDVKVHLLGKLADLDLEVFVDAPGGGLRRGPRR